MKSVISQPNLTRAAAAVLAAWLSGLVLLFCCVGMPHGASAAKMAESCPLAKEHHQKKSNERAADFAAFQEAPKALDCCAFLPNLLGKTQNFEKNSLSILAEKVEKPAAPKFSYAAQSVPERKIYLPAIRDRGGTYLKNCVFRI